MREHSTPGYGAPGADDTIQHVFHRDYETRSTCDLRKTSAFVYAMHETTEVLCCAYAFDNQPVQLWLPGDPVPQAFIDAAADPNTIAVSHNAEFERAVETHIMGPKYGWPLVPLERQRCTMAMAAAQSLPSSLSEVATALRLANGKDDEGRQLMLQMCKPRHPKKGEDPAGLYWFEDPERLERLYAYCRADVEAERELYRRLRPLPPDEQLVWELDARINFRGAHVDRVLVESAQKVAAIAGPVLDAELARITDGAVPGASQLERIKGWLQKHGVSAPALDREAIDALLESEHPEPVRRVLELRRAASQASARKVDAILAHRGPDDRVRGMFRYHGASTGRWTGRGPQLQNLPRPPDGFDAEAAVAALMTGDYAHVSERYDNPLELIRNTVRSMVTAAPGRRLIAADFKGIEARVLAWLAGESWKLESFRREDTGGPEVYSVTAARIFGLNDVSSVTKHQRKCGKTCELAFGYQGGVRAFRAFYRNAEPVLTDEEIDRFKQDWRDAHPATRQYWYSLNDAAADAVLNPGKVVEVGTEHRRIRFKVEGAFLFLKLPSGRKLSYPYPRVEVRAHNDRNSNIVIYKDTSHGWHDCRGGHGAYGGVWCENVVSAVSRDLLAAALLRLEAAGYPIVLHVHDEAVSEVPDGFGTLDTFLELMKVLPGWAAGLPVNASGWAGVRFRKD